ncbi:actin-histidine N-methyltransferase-like isoform X2 [Xenia sp. Carnegie-2017]|uniref:actin-histidine N-methyltransferase-like isoform X2 n=1 Tax=Xenia sp. Carnegie-2017 TaxID=2897299 RepID=UPI001F0378B7|nr:actin-histidine N-methyltransferase-like isoform X2 [Xenia sp. Carnegie-2017]
MGKKKKNYKDSGVVISKSEETLLSSLLQKSSALSTTNANEQWKEHLEIRDLIEKIEKIQAKTDNGKETARRSDFLVKFNEWLKENEAGSKNVEVFSISDDDFGVRAINTFQAGEKILNIPRKLILTSEYSSLTFLGSIIATDRLLQVMPNVVLAIKLLDECYKDNSFWKPYIDILPRKFTIPLFFSLEELSLLKGSQILNKVLNVYKSIARQYAYLYQIFKKIPTNNQLNFMKSFTFKQYRWAVSIVMTRQNQIPNLSGDELKLALIPFLDMCNHRDGYLTTDYDVNADACVCYALDSCKPGDEVFIFYGPRSNADFFVHSGFYYENNKHDLLHIQLGISSSDPLYVLKTQLLSKLAINQKNLAVTTRQYVMTKDLLAFLRIFCITEESKSLIGENDEKFHAIFYDETQRISDENEMKVWDFIQTRCSLLLRMYPTTIEQDDEMLKAFNLSENITLAIKLRRNEKLLLSQCTVYSKEIIKKLSENSNKKS